MLDDAALLNDVFPRLQVRQGHRRRVRHDGGLFNIPGDARRAKGGFAQRGITPAWLPDIANKYIIVAAPVVARRAYPRGGVIPIWLPNIAINYFPLI